MLWGVLLAIVALILLILIGIAIAGIVFLVSAWIMGSKKNKVLAWAYGIKAACCFGILFTVFILFKML